MAKKKKLTSADANLDPDVPTELELRLEEELRSSYEAELSTQEERRGLKDVVVDDEKSLTLTELGYDRFDRILVEEEVKLEELLALLTREQLVDIVKEAVQKDKELGERVRKRFDNVLFNHTSDTDVKTQHRAEAGDMREPSFRRHKFFERGHQQKEISGQARSDVGALGTPVSARFTSSCRIRSDGLEQYPDQSHCPSWSLDYQDKYLPSGYRHGQISAQYMPGASAYDLHVAGAQPYNSNFRQASGASITKQGAADYWLYSLPGGICSTPINDQFRSLYSNNAMYGNQQQQLPIQKRHVNNQYWPPHTQRVDSIHYTWPNCR